MKIRAEISKQKTQKLLKQLYFNTMTAKSDRLKENKKSEADWQT